MTRAYVGLGANLGDREATLRAALERLGAVADVDVVAVSAFRETEPVGYLDQPPFVNAAAAVETAARRGSSWTRSSPWSARSAVSGRDRGSGRGRSTSICCSTAKTSSTNPA